MISPDDLFDQDPEDTERDPMTPAAAPVPCRTCLGIGVEYTKAEGFRTGCRNCGRTHA